MSRLLHPIQPYAISASSVALATLLITQPRLGMSASNVALIYLLLVFVTAITFGLGPTILLSVLAFLAFNFFFVLPLYTFHVADPQDVLRLLLFLTVAIIASSLASRARGQANTATRQARELGALYQLSQASSAEVNLARSLPLVVETTAQLLHVPACRVLLYNEMGKLVERASFGTEPARTFHRSDVFLRVGPRVLGVLRVTHASLGATLSASQQNLLDTIAAQVVLLVERARLVEETSQVRVLAESNRLKSVLLSSVSHDLRTPLAVIKGAVTDLLDSTVQHDPAAQHDLLHAIDDEAQRLNRLVGNLLEMSRIEAAALHTTRSWQDVGELIRAVVDYMRPQLGERPIVLSVPADLPPVQINYSQIDRVLTNLLENAVKYSPQGTSILVQALATSTSVQVAVSDQGPGIPIAMTTRIFEKFVRGTGPERHADGSGLGLAICKGIIEAHGGRIWAENQCTGGARFVLTLPYTVHAVSDDMLQMQEVHL